MLFAHLIPLRGAPQVSRVPHIRRKSAASIAFPLFRRWCYCSFYRHACTTPSRLLSLLLGSLEPISLANSLRSNTAPSCASPLRGAPFVVGEVRRAPSNYCDG